MKTCYKRVNSTPPKCWPHMQATMLAPVCATNMTCLPITYHYNIWPHYIDSTKSTNSQPCVICSYIKYWTITKLRLQIYSYSMGIWCLIEASKCYALCSMEDKAQYCRTEAESYFLTNRPYFEYLCAIVENIHAL